MCVNQVNFKPFQQVGHVNKSYCPRAIARVSWIKVVSNDKDICKFFKFAKPRRITRFHFFHMFNICEKFYCMNERTPSRNFGKTEH